MQETWFRSLIWEDPLEKETGIYLSILAWRIPCSPAGYSPWCRKESDMTELTNFHFFFFHDKEKGVPWIFSQVKLLRMTNLIEQQDLHSLEENWRP